METERWSSKEGDIFFLFSGLRQVQIIKRKVQGRSLRISKPEVAGLSVRRRNAYCGFCVLQNLCSIFGGRWIAPFYFHMPIKKDGVSEIILWILYFAYEEIKAKRGELLNRLWREKLSSQLLAAFMSCCPPQPKPFHMRCGLTPQVKAHPRVILTFLKVIVRAWLEAGLICKVWETYWNYQDLEHGRRLHWGFTALSRRS